MIATVQLLNRGVVLDGFNVCGQQSSLKEPTYNSFKRRVVVEEALSTANIAGFKDTILIATQIINIA